MITKEFLLIVSLVLCNTELGMLGPSPAISQTSQAVLESAAFKRCYNDYAARTSQEDLYGLKEYLKSALEDAFLDSISQVNPISLDADIRYFTERLQSNMKVRHCQPAQSEEPQLDFIVLSVKDTADEMGLNFQKSAYGRISAILTNILRTVSIRSLCESDSLLQ